MRVYLSVCVCVWIKMYPLCILTLRPGCLLSYTCPPSLVLVVVWLSLSLCLSLSLSVSRSLCGCICFSLCICVLSSFTLSLFFLLLEATLFPTTDHHLVVKPIQSRRARAKALPHQADSIRSSHTKPACQHHHYRSSCCLVHVPFVVAAAAAAV